MQDPASLDKYITVLRCHWSHKNIRNNMLNCKKCLFPLFTFDGFEDHINLPGGELKWKMFLNFFERDDQLAGWQLKAQKLTLKELHSGNHNQDL